LNVQQSVIQYIIIVHYIIDLIYLVLDKPEKDQDRRLARHLVSLYDVDDMEAATQDEDSQAVQDSVSIQQQSFLREYILYARNYIFPEISNEAEPVLMQSYLQMRSLGSAHYSANLQANGSSSVPSTAGLGSRRAQHITATPRQLESLIRLSQALAKMRLSHIVTAGRIANNPTRINH
jgi:DNA replication licensing factor MCM4